MYARHKKRKLKWFGCVRQTDALAKCILPGSVDSVERSRKIGRAKKNWHSNITEWTMKNMVEAEQAEEIGGSQWLQNVVESHNYGDPMILQQVMDPKKKTKTYFKCLYGHS